MNSHSLPGHLPMLSTQTEIKGVVIPGAGVGGGEIFLLCTLAEVCARSHQVKSGALPLLRLELAAAFSELEMGLQARKPGVVGVILIFFLIFIYLKFDLIFLYI